MHVLILDRRGRPPRTARRIQADRWAHPVRSISRCVHGWDRQPGRGRAVGACRPAAGRGRGPEHLR